MPAPTDFAPVFPGWNVWAVWQKNDLDFDPMMIGVAPERQLRIWVEDEVRLHAGGADVADPVKLKGDQVEILDGPPVGLPAAATKEGVGGESALLLDGPPTLRYVRFFNHGTASKLPWPHDSDFLLDTVFRPDPGAPATSGEPPGRLSDAATEAAGKIGKGVLGVGIGLALILVVVAFARKS